MEWSFDNQRPIYTQLLEQIQLRIISGEYPLGSKLPSVRDLATEAAVNPNTMQRAFQELERNGLVTTQRTAGRTVTTDIELINNLREHIARDTTQNYLTVMKNLNIDIVNIKKYIAEEYKNDDAT